MIYSRAARVCSRYTFVNTTKRASALVCQPKGNVLQLRSFASEAEQAVDARTVSFEAAYPNRTDEHKPRLYNGIAQEPFPPEVSKILMAPLDPKDIEIKPDGMIYLPEIRYRRIMNKAFGPGAWALLPISPPIIERTNLIRSFALYCYGRFVSEATGEQAYFEGVTSTATAAEAAKSNALVRCCKDLGIGSELWDPQYIMEWKKKYSVEVQCENARSKDKKRLWRRNDRPPFEWPWKEIRQITVVSQPRMPIETGLDPLGLQLVLEDGSAEGEEVAMPVPPQQQYTQRAPQQQYTQYKQQAYQQQQQQAPQAYSRPPPPPPSAIPPPQQAVIPPPPPPPPPSPKQAQQPPAAEKKGRGRPAAAQPAEQTELTWDMEGLVPFKKHAGKKWKELLDAKGMNYLSWGSGSLQGQQQQDAIGFIAYIESQGGVEALRAKLGM